MTKPTKKPDGWSAARQHLATWDKPALLGSVKDPWLKSVFLSILGIGLFGHLPTRNDSVFLFVK